VVAGAHRVVEDGRGILECQKEDGRETRTAGKGGGGCTSQISSPMKYLCPVPSRAFVSAGAGLPVRRRGSALGSHLVHDGRVQLRELLFVEVSELGHWRAALGWLGARATQLRQSRSAVQLGCGARERAWGHARCGCQVPVGRKLRTRAASSTCDGRT